MPSTFSAGRRIGVHMVGHCDVVGEPSPLLQQCYIGSGFPEQGPDPIRPGMGATYVPRKDLHHTFIGTADPSFTKSTKCRQEGKHIGNTDKAIPIDVL